LWDHNFELPHKHLEASELIQQSVAVGRRPRAEFGGNDRYEIYDYPGEYATGLTASILAAGTGPPICGRSSTITTDRDIRMEQEAATAVEIHGASTCRQLVPGFKFILTTLPGDALSSGLKADGSYVVTSVSHSAVTPADRRSGTPEAFRYSNKFTAIPLGLRSVLNERRLSRECLGRRRPSSAGRRGKKSSPTSTAG